MKVYKFKKRVLNNGILYATHTEIIEHKNKNATKEDKNGTGTPMYRRAYYKGTLPKGLEKYVELVETEDSFYGNVQDKPTEANTFDFNSKEKDKLKSNK